MIPTDLQGLTTSLMCVSPSSGFRKIWLYLDTAELLFYLYQSVLQFDRRNTNTEEITDDVSRIIEEKGRHKKKYKQLKSY